MEQKIEELIPEMVQRVHEKPEEWQPLLGACNNGQFVFQWCHPENAYFAHIGMYIMSRPLNDEFLPTPSENNSYYFSIAGSGVEFREFDGGRARELYRLLHNAWTDPDGPIAIENQRLDSLYTT